MRRVLKQILLFILVTAILFTNIQISQAAGTGTVRVNDFYQMKSQEESTIIKEEKSQEEGDQEKDSSDYKDKEDKKMLRYLMPMAKEVYVFKPKNERGLSAQILADTIKEVADVSVTIESDVNAAVFRALDTAKPDDVLVACGSLSFMEEMEDIL